MVMEPPYTARVKTQTGSGISLWLDNTKTTRIVAVPDGSVVTVFGTPDTLGFALAEFNGNRGVGDIRFLAPVAEARPTNQPHQPHELSFSESLPSGEREAWLKIAHSYAMLSEAANRMGDMMQDFCE
jgi:hypothetical protein